MFIVGATGSGKSYAALSLGEAIDPLRPAINADGTPKLNKAGNPVTTGFDISRVAFSADEFLRIVRRDLPPGSAVLFDEAGVDAGARRSMSSINIVMSHTFQTIRNKNNVVFITVPSMSMVDKHIRMLSHLLLVTKGINYVSGVARLRVYTMIPSTMTDTIYRPHPVLRIKGGQKVAIIHVRVSKPSTTLIRAYERAKTRFGNRLLDDGWVKVVGDVEKGSRLTPTEKSIYEAITKWRLKPKEIAQKLNLQVKGIYDHISSIRRKGYLLERASKKSQI